MLKKKKKLGLLISVLGALAVLILLNKFVSALTEKFPLRYDLTGNKVFELSDETKDLLKNAEKDVDLYYFATKGKEQLYIKETLDMYKGYSDKIHFEQKDPTADPVFAREFGSEIADNSVVVRCGNRTKTVDSSALYDYTYMKQGLIEFQFEQKLTKAIAYVLSEKDTKVLFTKGHEEIGLPLMKTPLEDENAEVSEIDLKTEDIPEDVSALYIIGPKRDFSADEISKLQSYLAYGGALNISLDIKASGLSLLRQFLSEFWGINFGDDIIMETESRSVLGNSPFYLVPKALDHEITKSFAEKNVPIVWPEARSISPAEKGGIEAAALLETSENAVTKSDSETVSYTVSEGDKVGKQTLAAALSYIDYDKKTRTRIVATGTSLYAAEVFLNEASVANADFLRNSFSFLKGDETSSVSVMPKNIAQAYMTLTQSKIKEYMWLFGILPEVLVLAAGLFVWLKRRRL